MEGGFTVRSSQLDLWTAWSAVVGLSGANGRVKLDHGSGGMAPSRRSKTLPVCQPFPVVGRAGGFTPWSCIAGSVWAAGRG